MEESRYKGKTGLRRVINAFGYSIDGLGSAIRNEPAFRQELVLAAVLIPVALFVDASGVERAVMIASVLIVLIVELLNSAVEAAVDRVSLDDHLLAKRAKDMGSAAVLLALVNLVAVWVSILFG